MNEELELIKFVIGYFTGFALVGIGILIYWRIRDRKKS